MIREYPIYHLYFDKDAARQVRGRETMGTKQKWWLSNRRTGRMVLLKLARPDTGEDWSEKVAYEIARRLSIPCPNLELAKWEEQWDVLCWDFLGQKHVPGMSVQTARSLSHGNELLLRRDPKYPANERFRVSAHTIPCVHEVLNGVDHMGRANVLDGERGDGFDMFVGYLLLDALIGNTDRHHENWGIITSQSENFASTAQDRHQRLAPTYDHASSLGRELNDAKRATRLGNSGRGTVEGYAMKASSAFWSEPDGRSLTPSEALLAASQIRPRALAAWQSRLVALPLMRCRISSIRYQRCA